MYEIVDFDVETHRDTFEVSAIDFTTLTTVPGTVKVHGAPIQILDLPGIIEGANDGRGRGRQVIAGTPMAFLILNSSKPI